MNYRGKAPWVNPGFVFPEELFNSSTALLPHQQSELSTGFTQPG
jgi:hypothetical protein